MVPIHNDLCRLKFKNLILVLDLNCCFDLDCCHVNIFWFSCTLGISVWVRWIDWSGSVCGAECVWSIKKSGTRASVTVDLALAIALADCRQLRQLTVTWDLNDSWEWFEIWDTLAFSNCRLTVDSDVVQETRLAAGVPLPTGTGVSILICILTCKSESVYTNRNATYPPVNRWVCKSVSTRVY